VGEVGPLLQAILPTSVRHSARWSTLKREPGDSIDEALTERQADLVFSCETGSDGPWLFLVLVEHQSTVNRWMALRVKNYVTRIASAWLDNHPGASHPPEVLPVVVYHGLESWDAPMDYAELVRPASRGAGARHPPCHQGYILDDLSRVSREQLSARALGVFGHLSLRALKDLGGGQDAALALESWVGLLEAAAQAPGGPEHLLTVLEYLGSVANIGAQDVDRVMRRVTPEHAETIMSTLAERMKEEGRAEGKAEGRAEGKAWLMLKQLQLKFGAVPPEVEARVRSGTDADFDRWAEGLAEATSIRALILSPIGEGWVPPA
jgi:hypothetical protein